MTNDSIEQTETTITCETCPHCDLSRVTGECECGVDEYVWVPDILAWGDEVSEDEHAAACERAEAWLTEHEGEDVSISVRPMRRGEAPGTYRRRSGGDLQILGYSIAAPEEIAELIGDARAHACETWPVSSAPTAEEWAAELDLDEVLGGGTEEERAEQLATWAAIEDRDEQLRVISETLSVVLDRDLPPPADDRRAEYLDAAVTRVCGMLPR